MNGKEVGVTNHKPPCEDMRNESEYCVRVGLFFCNVVFFNTWLNVVDSNLILITFGSWDKHRAPTKMK